MARLGKNIPGPAKNRQNTIGNPAEPGQSIDVKSESGKGSRISVKVGVTALAFGVAAMASHAHAEHSKRVAEARVATIEAAGSVTVGAVLVEDAKVREDPRIKNLEGINNTVSIIGKDESLIMVDPVTTLIDGDTWYGVPKAGSDAKNKRDIAKDFRWINYSELHDQGKAELIPLADQKAIYKVPFTFTDQGVMPQDRVHQLQSPTSIELPRSAIDQLQKFAILPK